MQFLLQHAVRELTLPDSPKLIEPWLTAGSVNLVFGPPSAGKSMWMESVARALAGGDTLFGMYPCAPCRVLLVQADMPIVMVVERAQAVTSPASPHIGLWLTDNAALDVLTAGKAHANVVAEARAFDPQVVFVDTLRKTHHLDENDSSAPDRIYAAWRLLFPDASFVFLHHSRKAPSQPASTEIAVREAFRGSIAWAASADTIISIKRARRKGNKEWLVQQRFIRTRGCEEPPPLLLRRTNELLLEPVHVEDTPEHKLFLWLDENPAATRTEAVRWLQTLVDARGNLLCGERRAYRVYDRILR